MMRGIMQRNDAGKPARGILSSWLLHGSGEALEANLRAVRFCNLCIIK